jgi:HYR domain/Carboxypeptidase regulatory-like domain
MQPKAHRCLSIVLYVIAILIALAGATGNASAWTLSGTVYGGGPPLPNTLVEALANGTTTVLTSSTTDAFGHYSLSLADGTYGLRVTPPSGSGFGQETVPVVMSGANQVYDVILLAGGTAISGTVRGFNGQLLANVQVRVTSTSGSQLGSALTDSAGYYSVALSPGTVNLSFSSAFPASANEPSQWYAYRNLVTVSGPTTIDLNLPVVQLSGTVKGSDGSAVSGASISGNASQCAAGAPWCYNASIGGALPPAMSGSTGAYSLLLITGSASLTTFPPSGGAYSSLLETLTLTGNTIHDIVLPSAVALTGTVRGFNGQPLARVQLRVTSTSGSQLGSALTDSAGYYSVALSPGTVNLSFSSAFPASANEPSQWYAYRNLVTVSGPTTIDLNLPVVQLSGTVKGSDGSAVSGASISGNASQCAAGAPWCYNASIGGALPPAMSGSTGAYSLLLITGSASLTTFPPSGGAYSSLLETLTLTGNTIHDIVLPSAVALTGTVRGFNGQPLARVQLRVTSTSGSQLGSALTDSAGYYSVALSPGTVNLSFSSAFPASANEPSQWYAYRNLVTVSGPTTIDLNLPVVQLSGKVTDSNGAPVPNVSISGNASQCAAGALWCYNASIGGALPPAISDSAGAYSLLLIAGSASFTITPPAQSGFAAVFLSNVSLAADLTQRIILQLADVTPPQIVAGPVVVHLSDTSVSISWTTNEAATSQVEYGIGALTTTINDPTLTTNHEVTLLNLGTSTIYQFQVGSVDAAGNGPTYSSVGTFTTQAPPGDITPPVITSGPTVSSIDQSSAIVQWTTDEPASSTVSYGVTSSLGTVVNGPAGLFTQTHSVRLTGLASQTMYLAQVTTADPSKNTTTSSIFTFTTLAVPDTTPPVIKEGPTVQSKTDTTITVNWTTDEPATSGVSYNDGTHFSVVNDAALTKTHVMTLSGLTPSTPYTIRVSSTDAAGNPPTVSAPITATTDATPDTTPPILSAITVTDITQTSAVISWTTNEPATSAIRYGPVSGSPDNTTGDVALVTNHVMRLTGLLYGAKYYFVVSSADASANTATSTELTFTVAASPQTFTNSILFPTGLTFDGTVLYLSHGEGNREIFKLDPQTGAILGSIPLGGDPRDLVFDGAGYLFASDLGRFVAKVDTQGTPSGSFPLPFRGGGIAFDGTNFYVGDFDSSSVLVTDRSGAQIRTLNLGLIRPEGMVFDPTTGHLWVITEFDSTMYEITTQGTTVRTCNSPFNPGTYGLGGITLVGSKFYIAEPTNGDPFTGTTIFALDRNSLLCQAAGDTTPPVIGAVSNLTAEATSAAGAVVSFALPGATDSVDPSPVVTANPASGSTFALGATTVTVTATDAANNTSTKTFTVTVRDTTPPVIGPVTDIIVDATSPSGAVVTFALPAATDSVDPSPVVTANPVSGNTFALGATTVTVTAKDSANNTSTKTFTVTVRDTTPPVMGAVSNLTVEATSAAGAAVTFALPAATDSVDPSPVVTANPASGNTFALGTTTVTVTAKDSANNTSTKTFTVTVRDTTPPVIGSVNDITVGATSPSGAVVTFATPTATDAVDPAPAVTASPVSGSAFPVGSTTVTVTATDASGNKATRSFKVTVLSAAQQASGLLTTVATSFPQASGLLQNALDSLNAGNTGAACNQMSAFINQVQAQSGKKLTVAQANQLIASAAQIKGAIGCP